MSKQPKKVVDPSATYEVVVSKMQRKCLDVSGLSKLPLLRFMAGAEALPQPPPKAKTVPEGTVREFLKIGPAARTMLAKKKLQAAEVPAVHFPEMLALAELHMPSARKVLRLKASEARQLRGLGFQVEKKGS